MKKRVRFDCLDVPIPKGYERITDKDETIDYLFVNAPKDIYTLYFDGGMPLYDQNVLNGCDENGSWSFVNILKKINLKNAPIILLWQYPCNIGGNGMKTKRIGFLKGILSVVFMLALIVTMVAVMPMTVSATNVSEVVYASNLVDGDDIVLIGDTTLYVNADVSLKSIKGDYALEIQSDGEHTLTIDNPNGSAIYVKTLKSVKPSQGTVNLTIKGGDDYFAIATTGDISLAGIKLDVNGSAGIRSEEGNVTINGTNVSVVGSDGVGVVANSGSISIDSDYLFVQCAGQSGDAMWEHGIGAAKDVTIISDDATIAGSIGIESDNGNITLNGNIAVGGTGTAVYAIQGTITMTGAVTAQGGDDYFAIYAKGDISFDGTKLDAKGGAGIRSDEGNVTINGTSVSVVGSDGIGVVANSGSISIDSDYLFVQCAGQSGDAMWEHGVGALKNITIISDDAIIAGRYGVASDEGNISLTGTFWVGARNSAICATAGNITVNGDLTANNTDGNYYCVVSGEGDITLSNGTFNITSASNAVITHNGSIYLNGDITVSSSEADSCAINAREGDIIIQGGFLDVTTGGTYALGASNGQINIAQSLKILAPLNCRIDTNNVIDNASVIVDANGNPVSHVEIGHGIGEVSVYINSPVAGDKPASSASDVYLLPEHSSVKSIEWFVSDVPHSNSEAFAAGVKYKVRIVLKADDGYRFEGGQTAKINGKDASTGTSNGGKELIITYTFNDCPSVIKNIELNVAAPAEGNNISYSVTDESAGYSVADNSDWVRWYESNDGVSYSLMVSGSEFVGGRYYKIEIDVKTHTGYEFALKDIGTIQPDVSAIVNGFKATVSKAWEQDPSEAITVTYTFGLCNDTIIENITIVDVPKPVLGEKPVYTVAVLETGYHIENRNVSREVYEGGQYVDKYYIRNGIAWWDVTNGGYEYVYENDVFLPGHDYQCVVYVQTDDGYEFVQDLYTTPEVWPTATVNGNAATILKDGSGLTTNQQVRYTFVYEVQNVSNVEIFDIDTPVGNKAPDYTATLGNAGLYEFATYGYELAGFWWYDSEDNVLTLSNKFVKGETYKLEIKLVHKMDGQRVLTQFQTPVTAILNGKAVDSADVFANTTTVYIYQTYTCDTEYLIEIDSVSATVTAPLVGEKPNYEATSGDSDKYTVTVHAWYEESVARGISTNSNFLDPDSYFVQGRSYRVKVSFTPKPGYKFADEVVFYINGVDTTAWGRSGQEQAIFTTATNTKPTYLVTFDPTEGSGTMIGNVVADNVTFTLGECEFIAPNGFKFKAWAIGSPSGEQKMPGQTIVVTEDTYQIYAVWKELPHTCFGISESGQSATCTVNGWKDYYRCECGKYYEDANCEILIPDLEAWKVGAGKITAAHSGTPEWIKTATTHAKKYTCCDTFVVETEAHEWNNGTCSECGYVCLHAADTNKDHKCDACGSTVGTHEAALGKHTCDYCEKTVTECADSNKDHKCDTCGEAMGTHVAASGKHTCDYCGKTASECADANDDGKCDICGANYGACVDSNKDHLCDKHGETMGTHEAALGKHTCDYCNKPVTECSDDNKDHKCDTCGEAMGTHVAASGKHTCDYCNKVVTECADGNKDHKCDTCSTAMGTHVAATGKHTCDYCGKTVTECSDSDKNHKCDTCSSNMGIHEVANGKHTCDYCTEVVTQCADSNKDHKCDICGTAMGIHEAASGKHTCDYCGKTVTECADTNSDGKCDTCGANYGECVDINKDHKCDKHGEAMGTHEAALGKHTCDYCGKTVTDCTDFNKDHKCDTCSTAMGTHEAANGKHTCDYCGVAITECVDTNKDHKCDTCGASVGVHNAATGKHTCDYCGKTVTECTDSSEDDDSKCDICGKNIGDCVDANKDHKCDKHDENMGVHEAALGKHTCDYCGKTVTECADANKDHKCDTCDTTVGTHEAATGKHTCDYCGKTVTECADSNKDHKCDTCSTAMGTHEAANGKHSCDYCGKDVTECSDGNTDGKCDVCQKDLGTVHTHDYGTTWKNDANNHWNECACGDKANKAAHTDSNNNGKCDTCEYQMTNGGGNTETPDNPNNTPDDPSDDKDGLGAGAIVGIVIGSVAVVGIGGFALFWFVIKKKSFADLIAVFKK